MKKHLTLLAAIFLVSLCAAPLWAQIEGSIKGVAKDEAGKPIAGATIVVTNEETSKKLEVKTNDAGEYFAQVEPGKYTVTLMQKGVMVLEFKAVPVTPGKEGVPVDFDLAKNKPGLTEEERKQLEAAQKHHEKVKGLNAMLSQAKELEGAGSYDQAITVLQQATQQDPNQDLIWANLAEAHAGAAAHASDAQAKSQHYQAAVEAYQKALAIKPNSPIYMANLGNVYSHSKQPEKALEQYNAAVQADPQNAANYYFSEGVVYTNTNKPDEAIAVLDKVIQADPNRAEAYYLKGQNLMQKSTSEGSKLVAPPGTAECFNKYLELKPDGPLAATAKSMLASIGATVETNYGKGKSGSKKK